MSESQLDPDSVPSDFPKIRDHSGIPEDFDKWEEPSPQRIKVSPATAAERTKYEKMLKQIFDRPAVEGKRIKYTADEVMDVLMKVRPILESEPVFIEDIPGDIYVVGDLHGQLFDLNRIFFATAKNSQSGYECGRFLFLGDYVDRGSQSLEIVMALFMLKYLHPDRFFILRGNHEFAMVNSSYGFMQEMLQRFGKTTGRYMHEAINLVFLHLSICAVIGDKIFCVHAGITSSHFNRNQLRSLTKPIYFSADDHLVHDLVWSDPADGLSGTTFNTNRQTSIFFGEDALHFALKNIGCIALIRGHTMLLDGFQVIWERCINIFSATDQTKEHNSASYAYFSETLELHIFVLKYNPKRSKSMAAIKAAALARKLKQREKAAAAAAAAAGPASVVKKPKPVVIDEEKEEVTKEDDDDDDIGTGKIKVFK